MWDVKLPPYEIDLVPDFVKALPDNGTGVLAIFDADGTLWRDDVADDFTRWMIDSGHVETGHLWDEYIRIYRDDHEAGCQFLLSLYAGLTEDELHEHVFDWWARVAKRRWVPEAVAALRHLAERGYTTWVVTGSPTDTMLPLCEFLPVDLIVGMDFELDEARRVTGRYTGISCTDAGKARKVEHLWGTTRPIAFAAGNGSLDAAMMELATVQWSVYPNPTFEAYSRERGWHILPRPADFVEEAKLA